MPTIREYDYAEGVTKTTRWCTTYDTVGITNTGGFNYAHIHPSVVSTAMLSTLSGLRDLSTSTECLIQIIKLPKNNIHEIDLVAGLTSLTSSTFDTMDYANDAGTRAVWAANVSTRIQSYNDKTIFYQGTSSMRLTTNNNNAVGYYVQRDLGATGTDFTTSSAFKFAFRKNSQSLTIRLQVVDTFGVISNSPIFGVANVNSWEIKEILVNQFVDAAATATDWTKIRYVRFICTANTASNQSAWIDDMTKISQPSADNMRMSLYHCGSVEPTASATLSDWTLVTSDQGNTVSIISIQKLNEVGGDFVNFEDSYGTEIGSTPLIVNDYYAMVICRNSVDTVALKGISSSTQQYTYGKLFYSANSGVTMTEETGDTIHFRVFSVVTCKLHNIDIICDGAPKNSEIYFISNDGIHHNRSLVTDIRLHDTTDKSIPVREFPIEYGDGVKCYIKHDTAATTFTKITVGYLIEYEAFTIYS